MLEWLTDRAAIFILMVSLLYDFSNLWHICSYSQEEHITNAHTGSQTWFHEWLHCSSHLNGFSPVWTGDTHGILVLIVLDRTLKHQKERITQMLLYQLFMLHTVFTVRKTYECNLWMLNRNSGRIGASSYSSSDIITEMKIAYSQSNGGYPLSSLESTEIWHTNRANHHRTWFTKWK